MAELPKSWGLKKVKRSDGKLDLVGKDDLGHDYRVRTTDGPQVTEKDIRELKAADRESYSNRAEGAKQFVGSLVEDSRARKQAWEDGFGSDMVDAAGPVAFAGLGRKGCSAPFSGSTRAYRKGWDRSFGGD
jgi:hypothetical protein